MSSHQLQSQEIPPFFENFWERKRGSYDYSLWRKGKEAMKVYMTDRFLLAAVGFHDQKGRLVRW